MELKLHLLELSAECSVNVCFFKRVYSNFLYFFFRVKSSSEDLTKMNVNRLFSTQAWFLVSASRCLFPIFNMRANKLDIEYMCSLDLESQSSG